MRINRISPARRRPVILAARWLRPPVALAATAALVAAAIAALPTPARAAAASDGSATAAKPAPKSAAAPRAATSRQQLRDQAKGLALASETVGQITEAQLAVAARVLLGQADCEFDQTVAVSAVDGHPGHFHVGYKKAVYRMVPQETTTGAVRLEDKRAGIVWLQIPSKSMLMNARIGQRMVDACTLAEQRAAAETAARGGAAAAGPLGIAPPGAAAVAPPDAAPVAAPAPVPADPAAVPATPMVPPAPAPAATSG